MIEHYEPLVNGPATMHHEYDQLLDFTYMLHQSLSRTLNV